MAFVQIIEFQADDADTIRALGQEWQQATEGKATAQRVVVGQDRDDPTRFFNIVFFESYESAMANSELPGTQAMAEKMASIVSGPPTFHDLDVIDEM
jgi:quinol monooxygenase YgiN